MQKVLAMVLHNYRQLQHNKTRVSWCSQDFCQALSRFVPPEHELSNSASLHCQCQMRLVDSTSASCLTAFSSLADTITWLNSSAALSSLDCCQCHLLPPPNLLTNVSCSGSVIWILAETQVNQLINFCWTLLWNPAVPQPSTTWLLMSHYLPQDDSITENVSLYQKVHNCPETANTAYSNLGNTYNK